ncbi:Uncharacterised protein [Bordetella pertussis]|nr:Uncharacterised protein [Bordetella pertussis]
MRRREPVRISACTAMPSLSSRGLPSTSRAGCASAIVTRYECCWRSSTTVSGDTYNTLPSSVPYFV